jgi:hypothetical protein
VSPVTYELGFYILEDDILHSHFRENSKSYIALIGWTLWRRCNVSPVTYEVGFYILEDDILHSRRRENLKSYKRMFVSHGNMARGSCYLFLKELLEYFIVRKTCLGPVNSSCKFACCGASPLHMAVSLVTRILTS